MNDLIIRIFHHCECYSFIGERDTITFYVKKAPLAWNSTLIGKCAHHASILVHNETVLEPVLADTHLCFPLYYLYCKQE